MDIKSSFFLSAMILFMATHNGNTQTPQQPYTPVQKFPGFEVRYYPEAVMARVYSSASSYKEVSTPGFRSLAGYIFGDNAGEKKIAMTTPVYIDLAEQGSSMSFVMPSEYEPDDLPQPNNPSVHIETTKPQYLAVITFGGYASDQLIKEQREKLQAMLRANNIEYKGNFLFLGYNSPYKFWNRRNEVAVQIIWE